MVEACDLIKRDRPEFENLKLCTLFLDGLGLHYRIDWEYVLGFRSQHGGKLKSSVVLIFLGSKSYAFSDQVFVATWLWGVKLSFYIVVCFVL